MAFRHESPHDPALAVRTCRTHRLSPAGGKACSQCCLQKPPCPGPQQARYATEPCTQPMRPAKQGKQQEVRRTWQQGVVGQRGVAPHRAHRFGHFAVLLKLLGVKANNWGLGCSTARTVNCEEIWCTPQTPARETIGSWFGALANSRLPGDMLCPNKLVPARCGLAAAGRCRAAAGVGTLWAP